MADKKQSYQSFFQGAFSIFSPRCQKPGTVTAWPVLSQYFLLGTRKQRKNKRYSCQLICKVPRMWERILTATEYRSSLEVGQVIGVIYEWSPTFANVHFPPEQPLTGDDRGLAQFGSQKKMDTHPGNFINTWSRRRHSWILKDGIHVRSETEKNSMTNALHLLACKCLENQTHQ